MFWSVADYITRHHLTLLRHFTWPLKSILIAIFYQLARWHQHRSTIGDRVFPVAAACAWNSLPSSIRTVSSLNAFWDNLKTVLFKASFGWLDKTAAIITITNHRHLWPFVQCLCNSFCDCVTLNAFIHSFIHSFIHYPKCLFTFLFGFTLNWR